MSTNASFEPQCESVTLPNGLRIVSQQSQSPAMYCGFMVDCGTRDESTPQLYGMAHFVEHILFKGTTQRDSWHINNRIESVGGELNAFTTKEETTFYAMGLNKDFARACELLCDLICHPTAPQHELEKEQEVVIDEIMSYLDTPSEFIYDEFENQLFAQHTLGHNILGSEDTVRTFGHDECIQFIRQHYTPSRLIFFHQGTTPFSRVVSCVQRYFDMPDAADSATPQPRQTGTIVPMSDIEPLTVLQRQTHQSHVLVGNRTYPIGHDYGTALALLINILGGPGMNSRLGLELRERHGLVYSVECSNSRYTDTGYFGIYFGCDHHDVKRCLKLVDKQLDLMRRTPLTPRQLASAQRQYCGQIGLSRANLENNAIGMARSMLRRGYVQSHQEACQLIMQLTPELLHTVANEVLNKDLLKTFIIE